ncbi:hypothetical protein BJP41_07455 [Candidatus Williamhamiltonella defendens]|uniref:Murein endopeptidase K n=1 Tax=Candidatus Williamhamiltonella defendens TaxID=138072 RepID=A0A2D3T2Y4_9ENTR|nr:YcbK family protein [Candidatus Hamiltonella defensa]ASV33000.1 hypothetical protein CJJ18_01410 [Candidatus Hamiltonella defensa]ATW30178.1 hypothetical protein BJP41_07455 [Candidatus Hamiltonella defensa]ATW32188.1 hypothetical protein BJP42_07745 [Candidatus Hamiltonella defensa]AWK15951.1 hypothetical protein CCS40_01395 [Candidatus Hamiltonella defensa]MBK4361923.1 DUF882 domain-containing protein [Candidatus Hamiltonella defensa]
MDKIDMHRRKWFILGGAFLGSVLLSPLGLAASRPKPRILEINHTHTGEFIKTEFFDGRKYNKKGLSRLNYIFRDFRANKLKSIDSQLFNQLYRLQNLLGTNKPIQLISGYRTKKTNNLLRKSSSAVAINSFHTLGRAVDFYIEGIPLNKIYKAALRMRAGGVGYYPKSHFIHIDTGPVRNWSSYQ